MRKYSRQNFEFSLSLLYIVIVIINLQNTLVMIFNTTGFNYVSKIEFNDCNYESCYNHNYYTNGSELILEECDDADCFSYYRIIDNNGYYYLEYLGCIYNLMSIFEDDSQNEFELIQD